MFFYDITTKVNLLYKYCFLLHSHWNSVFSRDGDFVILTGGLYLCRFFIGYGLNYWAVVLLPFFYCANLHSFKHGDDQLDRF